MKKGFFMHIISLHLIVTFHINHLIVRFKWTNVLFILYEHVCMCVLQVIVQTQCSFYMNMAVCFAMHIRHYC